MSFLFDNNNTIYIKTAADPDPEKKDESYKAENDPVMQMAENVGQQAESVKNYEQTKSLTRSELRAFGLNEESINYVESVMSKNNIPPETTLNLTRKAMEATNKSGMPDKIETFVKMAFNSYQNKRNEKITSLLLELTGDLQSKHPNAPVVEDAFLATQSKYVGGDMADMYTLFGGKDEDVSMFRQVIALAQLSPMTKEEEAYFAYQSALDAKDKQLQNSAIVQALTDALQQSPFLMEESRLINFITQFYQGANESAGIRAWRGVLRSLHLGQLVKKYGISALSGQVTPTGVTKGTETQFDPSKLYVRSEASQSNQRLSQAQEQENQQQQKAQIDYSRVDELYKGYTDNWGAISNAFNTVGRFKLGQSFNQLSEALKNIQFAFEKLNGLKKDNSQEDVKILNEFGQILGNTAQQSPLIAESAQKKTQANQKNKIVTSQASGLGRGVGEIAATGLAAYTGAQAWKNVLEAMAGGDPTKAVDSVGALLLYGVNLVREFSGSAKVQPLTAIELKNQQEVVKAINILSGKQSEMSRWYNTIKTFTAKQAEYEKAVEDTVQLGVSLGGKATDTAVLGTEIQVVQKYNQLTNQLKNIIETFDKYLKVYEDTYNQKIRTGGGLPTDLQQAGYTAEQWQSFPQMMEMELMRFQKERQDVVSLYTKLYGISKIADKIQKENKILQQMKAIDEQAKGMSDFLGPGALQSVLLGKNGIYDRVKEIRQTETEALQKLYRERQQLQASRTNSDPSKISTVDAEIASVEKNINEIETKIQQIDNWFAMQDPMSGEYKSFLGNYSGRLAKNNGKFKVVADQKNIDYVSNYYTDLLEQSDAAPTPYGEAIKNPEKHHDETSKEMQQKWKKVH